MANAVLIDLSGVLYMGDALLPGGAEALDRLNATGMPYRFLTNTTRRPKRQLGDRNRTTTIDGNRQSVIFANRQSSTIAKD